MSEGQMFNSIATHPPSSNSSPDRLFSYLHQQPPHLLNLTSSLLAVLDWLHLSQIVVTPWAGPNTGSWSDWSSALHTLWHDHWWSEHFYVAHTAFPGTNQPLHAHFQQLTATACGVCDAQANHPFQSDSALCKHMIRQHHRHLCRLCLKVFTCLVAACSCQSGVVIACRLFSWLFILCHY